MTTMLIH